MCSFLQPKLLELSTFKRRLVSETASTFKLHFADYLLEMYFRIDLLPFRIHKHRRSSFETVLRVYLVTVKL